MGKKKSFIFLQVGLASAPARVRHLPNCDSRKIMRLAEESQSRLLIYTVLPLSTSSRLGKGSYARARIYVRAKDLKIKPRYNICCIRGCIYSYFSAYFMLKYC